MGAMDKMYWKKYYETNRIGEEPSQFAKYILTKYLDQTDVHLLELGCGNGRDSIFFAENGVNVNAVDQIEDQILFLKQKFKSVDNLDFYCGDFTTLNFGESYDIIYSRFTLHSINYKEQVRVLDWAFKHLSDNGLFCIEVRGKKNELYGKGEAVADEIDAYIYDQHYRRFIELGQLTNDLVRLGFKVEFAEEGPGFAPYEGSDETFIRVIVRR